MSISYPLSLPDTSTISAVTLFADNVTAVSQSQFSLSQQVFSHPGKLLRAEVVLKTMAQANAEVWVAFLVSLKGMEGTFLMGDPAGATPRGSVPGTPLVNGATQTGSSLITDGWTASQTGILKAGDWIQLGSGSTARMYKILVDVDSDSSGDATLDIWPNLRTSPTDGATVVTSNCVSNFRLIDNSTPWSINTAKHYGIVFSAMEAIT